MPPSESSIHNTPLAPSVEKAYYRKCIQLKRRLNEIESDNDSKKIKIERLNRGILKMRLERAFLLDELRKRMKYNVDGSEGSGSEGAATPPPDRPHRDKRRRPDSGRQAPSAGQQQQNQQQPAPQVPSQSERDDDLPTVQTNGNDAGPANGTDEPNPINRSAAATGEEVSAGPSILEDANVRELVKDYPDIERQVEEYKRIQNERTMLRETTSEDDKKQQPYKQAMADSRQAYKNANQYFNRPSGSPDVKKVKRAVAPYLKRSSESPKDRAQKE